MVSPFERDSRLFIEGKTPSRFLTVDQPPEGANPVIFEFLRRAASTTKYKNLSPKQRFLLETYFATDYTFDSLIRTKRFSYDLLNVVITAIDLIKNGLIVLSQKVPEGQRLNDEDLAVGSILKEQDKIFGNVRSIPAGRIRIK